MGLTKSIMQITFYTWLKAQKHREDPVGHISDIINTLDGVLGDYKNKQVIRMMILKEADYDPEVSAGFNEAWKEYKKFRKLSK
jgi:uncharacterized protein YozE (UPF0346 family)